MKGQGKGWAIRPRNEYPENWREIADRVKGEAGWRCVRCHHPHETPTVRAHCDARCTHPRDGKQRILTVHHLDGDKANGRWWNLLPLCQVCHLTVQGKVMPERPYLWEHSEWFKVYVAGFYAWWFGGVEITREQAERQLHYWLAKGQPWLY